MNIFNNDPKVKEELLSLLKHHQELDAFVQGAWLTSEQTGDIFKGCFYGCLMQKDTNPLKEFSDKYGVDLWYCHLTERIFENLPQGKFEEFPYKAIEALPLRFNFSKFKSLWFKTTLLKQLEWVTDDSIRAILLNTSKLFDVPFDEIDYKAAKSAAWSAWSVARSAWSAWSAVRSARSTRSAKSARSDHFVFLAELLFKLIKEND